MAFPLSWLSVWQSGYFRKVLGPLRLLKPRPHPNPAPIHSLRYWQMWRNQKVGPLPSAEPQTWSCAWTVRDCAVGGGEVAGVLPTEALAAACGFGSLSQTKIFGRDRVKLMESLVVGDIAELRPDQVGPSSTSAQWVFIPAPCLGGRAINQTQACSPGGWSARATSSPSHLQRRACPILTAPGGRSETQFVPCFVTIYAAETLAIESIVPKSAASSPSRS